MKTLLAVLLTVTCWQATNTPAFAQGAEQNADPGDLSEYRTELEALTRDGSWWHASNAAYADGDEAPDAYGTRFWVEPGRLSSVGCLWSIREGEPVTVHWRFFAGWDGVQGRPFYYQTHSSEIITGMGYLTRGDGPVRVMEQEFKWPDGSIQRIRHRTEWTDADTRVSESAIWSDGRWNPNRTYTWTRQTSGSTPCGPER